MNIITLPLGPLETNCYVVFENAPGACALVDPGAQAQSILDCLKERGLTPGLILLTHAHFDHTGALRELHAQYPDVPIYVSAQDTDETLNMSHGNLVYTDTFLDGDKIFCRRCSSMPSPRPDTRRVRAALSAAIRFSRATRSLRAAAAEPIFPAARKSR